MQSRPVTHVAVRNANLNERAREPHLEARAVARHRGQKVGQAHRPVERLAVPVEPAGRREGPRDRRPSERDLHIGQGLNDAVSLVAEDHVAVADANLRERFDPLRARRERAGERFNMAGPVRAAIRGKRNHDGRTHQRHVGDLDATDQEWQEAQPHQQLLGGERGGAGAVVAEADIVEADAAGREQRDRHVAAQHRVEAGHRADLRLDGLAHGIGRDRPETGSTEALSQPQQACNGKSKAFDAGGGEHV